MGRFITEDPIRAGANWFIYANNSPLRYTDPMGLLSEEHEKALADYSTRAGANDEGMAALRADYVDEEVGQIKELEEQLNSSQSQDEALERSLQLSTTQDDLLRNIQEADYDQASDLVDSILNDKLANEALGLVGSNYIWGGKPGNNKGGLDCSGAAEAAIEQAVSILLRTRNANGMATDSNLTKAGNGSRGTLNFYDWPSSKTSDYDHVTVSLGNGLMVHPQGGPDNNNLSNPGTITIRGPFNTVPVNRQINWHYILFD